jgi:23S rRNA-/tRNA-specific pseudouridylate synthase
MTDALSTSQLTAQYLRLLVTCLLLHRYSSFSTHRTSQWHDPNIKRGAFAPPQSSTILRAHNIESPSNQELEATITTTITEPSSSTANDNGLRPSFVCDEFTNEPIPIPILYESDNVLAISKPPHIPHHDTDSTKGILSHIRHLQSMSHNSTTSSQDNTETGGGGGNSHPFFSYQGRLYGVHRLDQVTSGILLFAKHSNAASSLTKAFRDRSVTKWYVALTNLKPKKKKQGWVKGEMVPSRRKSWKLTQTSKNSKNFAITRFFTAGLGNCHLVHPGNGTSKKHPMDEAINSIETPDSILPKTMILFQPHTGKTHQLRVAAKSVGLPILGDPIYANAAYTQGTERAYLHAAALHVNINGEDICIWDPPSNWFDGGTCDNERTGEAITSLEYDDGSRVMETRQRVTDVLNAMMIKHCEDETILKQV